MNKKFIAMLASVAAFGSVSAQSLKPNSNGLYLDSPYTFSLGGGSSYSNKLFYSFISEEKFDYFMFLESKFRDQENQKVMSLSKDGVFVLNGSDAKIQLWQFDSDWTKGMAAHLSLDYRDGKGYTLASTGGGSAAPMNYIAKTHDFSGDMTVSGKIEGNELKASDINAENFTMTGSKAKLALWQADADISKGMAAHVTLDYREGKGYTLSSNGGGSAANMNYIAKTHDFSGNMKVNGKIECVGEFKVAEVKTDNVITKDIKISMSDVADYVFDKNYDLKELSEVETYVNENKHLPGVPSAAEIEADGVSVSKMTNILLEKVEELTLHMIRLEKENAALKAEVESLKK